MKTKRLLVSLDESIFEEIEYMAKANQKSLSKIAKDLIISSLELEEDAIFSKLADERLKSTTQWIRHEDAWK